MQFYGASGHAKVVMEAWIEAGGKVTAVFDDNDKILSILNFPVSGKFNPDFFPTTPLVISIGSNEIRRKISLQLSTVFGKVFHPRSIISRSALISDGTVVMAGAVVNSSSQFGKHVILNTGAKVDHDCLLGDFVHIAPNATLCGNVVIGEGTIVGAGTTIAPQCSIGKWSIIGAGSAVIGDIPDNVFFAGNPAKFIRFITH
jgi:sugar O-acyltransferase (sialic acid O-acetyltransferase NeuD family)